MFESISNFVENRLRSAAQLFVPSWVILNLDIIISVVGIFITYLLRFNFSIPVAIVDTLTVSIVIYLVVRVGAFLSLGTYRMYIRYTSIKDLIRVVFTIFLGNVFFTILNFGYYKLSGILMVPLSIIIIDFFITSYLLIAFRIFAKYTIHGVTQGGNRASINVLVYGREHFSVSVKRALESDQDLPYKVIGFMDHNTKALHKTIEGLSIFPLEELDRVISDYDVRQLIFADAKIPAEQKNIVVQMCLNRGVKVKSLKNFTELTEGSATVLKVDEIRIEDLLEREPILLDANKISSSLKGKNILVTGAAGSIGSEIVRQVFSYYPGKLILLDQAETPLYFVELEMLGKFPDRKDQIEVVIGDIADPLRMRKIFEAFKIDVIFHAAAYKHVPLMENNPREAIKNNVFGTKNLADLAVEFGVEKFVMISTDKAVNPTNVMGATKRMAEIYTQSFGGFARTQFITTRFGNVLGSNGSVIPLFKKQIDQGGPLTVTHPEVTRFFMTIPEACQLVLEASVMGHGGEIFIFDMGKSVKIVDLAKNMIRLSGHKVGTDMQIVFTGLRPGEKLYEELLNTGENTLPTYHPKIMTASIVKMPHDLIQQYMDEISTGLDEDLDNFWLVTKMKVVVPEYVSQNSIYSTLDKK
ncbi:polysaccharide biosynthesis protein [Williamwhitmania taraxaci]|uniref:NDP-sugar epimerase, includes UDP-GlcNAc-inverting 4,6-dehydratase FlaA1 and capsular polysaccharide biosynthesis protein EpsC n=1 Tax=Williamwhitmania taraxaci TaxID=1640674 RepID=A0A1G6GMM6_9BACT|nr:nucleoside-diphosphate sugar epimerase/dehydratase [Williamwhitmania taraxaci]SDB82975.1 NDP-sugar epimerase, includes UDP-GlcNAc-inverting 4,6-dehydratase FlaA1 and capsular polysaccharide biosynthesis protein EpsC [Williamwhitmania taraxaci]